MSPESSMGSAIPDSPMTLTEFFRGPSGNIGFAAKINGVDIGSVELVYDFEKKEIVIDMVYVQETEQGYGVQIYKEVPKLPLPDGSDSLESGFRFVSTLDFNEAAERVWRSLVRDGVAQLMDDGRYIFL